jgi:hypothetical protein
LNRKIEGARAALDVQNNFIRNGLSLNDMLKRPVRKSHPAGRAGKSSGGANALDAY